MSESTTVLVQTETVGATVIVTGATVIGTVPIGPQGPPGVITADDVVDLFTGTPDGTQFLRDDGTLAVPAGAGGGAPDDATYLVTTAHADLTSEVVVGATPGGELGGTWASPTVDATHSGSSHASVQAAAEATAAAALSAHEADTTNVHGIANTALLETTAGAQAKADAKVTQTITNGVTTTAPSEDAVFDALALKQPLDADLTAIAAANNSAVLAATTAAFTTADETKIDHLTVTQAVDLDAIETRVNALDAAVVLKGTWDASAGTFPGGGTAQAGDSYIVSVAGTVDSVAFSVNDRILAIVDNASTGTYAANWLKLDYTDQVLSVAGQTGAVTLAKSDVGLGNVDNTSDANKPVSTAQQTALDLKANLASPALTGNPTAPTQTAGNSSTRLATTAFVQGEIDTESALLATAIADGDASTLTSANAHADTKIAKSTLDANSVLYATTDDTPAALAMGASTILARLAAGNIVAATPAQLRTLLTLVIGTDVQAWDADLDALATAFARATASGPASLAFLEDTDNGTNKLTVTAPAAVASDKTLTLPDATGTLITATQADAAYQPITAICAKGYRSAAWTNSGPAGSDVKIPFDTQSYDSGSIFEPSTGEMTAPSAGIYSVKSRCSITGAANGERYLMLLYVNGSLVHKGRDATYLTGNGQFTVDGSWDLQLAASDVVQIRLNQVSGTLRAIEVGSTNNYFTFHKVGN